MTNLCRLRNRKQTERRGAAIVEFAVIAPLLFFLIFGMIEFGRVIMVMQVMTNATREGARLGAVGASSESEIQTAVTNYLTGSAVPAVAIDSGYPQVTDENGNTLNFATITSGTKVKVTLQLSANKVTWLPMTWILPSTQKLITTAIMRRE